MAKKKKTFVQMKKEAISKRQGQDAEVTSDTVDTASDSTSPHLWLENSELTITVATSFAPKNIENQKAAVASWLKLGFRVISINNKEEIHILKQHFPAVDFVEAQRNALALTGKPYVFIDDILKAIANSKSQICGIVNSDIHFIEDNKINEFISHEAKDSFLYGCRINIDSFDSPTGEEYQRGYDYFFFDKWVTSLYPESTFCLGAPWWDLWAPLIPVINGIPIKKFAQPIGSHKSHPINWANEVDANYCREFFDRLSQKNINALLPADFRDALHYFLSPRLCKDFSAYVVTFLDAQAIMFSETREALSSFSQPVGQYLNPWEVLNMQAEKIYQSGNKEKGKQLFLNIARRLPHFKVLCNLSMVYWEEGLPEQSEVFLTKALRADSYDKDVILTVGQCLVNQNQYQRVKKLYRSYLNNNPDKVIRAALEELETTLPPSTS